MECSSTFDASIELAATATNPSFTDHSKAWPLPHELTLAIAMELTYPRESTPGAVTDEENDEETTEHEDYRTNEGEDSDSTEQDDDNSNAQEDNATTYTDLHNFRLVCKTFGIVGKSAWKKLAKQDPGYATLRLPPRKNTLLDLADVFLADGAALGKLVKTVRLSVYPSIHSELSDQMLMLEQSGWMSLPSSDNDIVGQQRKEAFAAIHRLAKAFGMSFRQMAFVQQATTIGPQAMLHLVLQALPDVNHLEINVVQADLPDEVVQEPDYHGSEQMLKSLAKLPRLTGLRFFFEDGWDENDCRTRLNDSMLRMAQSCFKGTFRDTNISSLTIHTTTHGKDPYIVAIPDLKNLETLDITLHGVQGLGNASKIFLSKIHESTVLKTLKVKYFDELENTGGPDSATTYLSNFLYKYGDTLSHVELIGYLGDEASILHLGRTMRNELQLESCRVRLQCHDPPSSELLRLLQYPTASENIFDESDLAYKACYPLDNYIPGLDEYILGGSRSPDLQAE